MQLVLSGGKARRPAPPRPRVSGVGHGRHRPKVEHDRVEILRRHLGEIPVGHRRHHRRAVGTNALRDHRLDFVVAVSCQPVLVAGQVRRDRGAPGPMELEPAAAESPPSPARSGSSANGTPCSAQRDEILAILDGDAGLGRRHARDRRALGGGQRDAVLGRRPPPSTCQPFAGMPRPNQGRRPSAYRPRTASAGRSACRPGGCPRVWHARVGVGPPATRPAGVMFGAKAVNSGISSTMRPPSSFSM